jgi:hypothetical protein
LTRATTRCRHSLSRADTHHLKIWRVYPLESANLEVEIKFGAGFAACAFSFARDFCPSTFSNHQWAKPRLLHPRRIRASRASFARKAALARGLGITRRGDLGEVAFVHKAMSLGYLVAKPYGQMHRYDFMVEGGNKLWRVQVKTSTCMRDGRYQLCVLRITHRRFVAYKKSELDFVVAGQSTSLAAEDTLSINSHSSSCTQRSVLTLSF